MIIRILFGFSFFLRAIAAYSGDMGTMPDAHPLYVGVNGGYGATTWQGLVPTLDNQNIVLSISTPVEVQEGGGVWGGMIGFEFSKHWGVEFNYLAYPKAKIFFDEDSLFAFENDDQTELETRTEALSLMAKIMLGIPNTALRAYSSVGVGWIHRNDDINNVWLVTPSFGVGLNYPLSAHFMGELAANYMSGYGESELSPVMHYVPFLYAVYARLAYRI
ncbi:MAG: outer membrane beta-barrel protein [Legionella sp.]|nr:outer membrane beta-barrel protein [Legionella sp.]